MKKFLIIGLIAITLAGCSGNTYDLEDPVSPKLEGLQTTDEFFDKGWELNDQITKNAVDNLMANWE